MTRHGGEKRHLVTIRLRVLEIINPGQLMHHAGEGRMGRHILDLRAVQPDFTAILETLDVARTCHGAQRCSGIERHVVPTFTVMPGVACLYGPSDLMAWYGINADNLTATLRAATLAVKWRHVRIIEGGIVNGQLFVRSDIPQGYHIQSDKGCVRGAGVVLRCPGRRVLRPHHVDVTT